MDFGTVAVIQKMIDLSRRCEERRSLMRSKAFINAYYTALRCIKGEFSRKTISEKEFEELVGLCDKYYNEYRENVKKNKERKRK